MWCWQKKDVSVQTSREQIDVHRDWNQQHNASSSTHTAGLPPDTSIAVSPTHPYHQCHVPPGLDVQTWSVTGPGNKTATAGPLPESDQRQTHSSIIPQVDTCAKIDKRFRLLSPREHLQATSVSCGTRVDEDGNGAEYDLPMPTISVIEDRFYSIHVSDEASTAHSVGDSGTKLPSSEARMPSRYVSHDRGPFDGSRCRTQVETADENILPSRCAGRRDRGPAADSHAEVAAHGDGETTLPFSQTRLRSRSMSCDRGPSGSTMCSVRAETDVENVVPSRCVDHNRRPSAEIQAEAMARSDVEKTVPSYPARVRSRSVSRDRVPSADRHARVPTDSTNDNTAHSLNLQRRHGGKSSKVGGISAEVEGSQQVLLSDNADEDVTGTSTWSEESPQQHGVHCQYIVQLPQVYRDLSLAL